MKLATCHAGQRGRRRHVAESTETRSQTAEKRIIRPRTGIQKVQSLDQSSGVHRVDMRWRWRLQVITHTAKSDTRSRCRNGCIGSHRLIVHVWASCIAVSLSRIQEVWWISSEFNNNHDPSSRSRRPGCIAEWGSWSVIHETHGRMLQVRRDQLTMHVTFKDDQSCASEVAQKIEHPPASFLHATRNYQINRSSRV